MRSTKLTIIKKGNITNLKPDGQALDLNDEFLLDLVGLLIHATDTSVSVVTQFTQLILELLNPETWGSMLLIMSYEQQDLNVVRGHSLRTEFGKNNIR